MSFFAPNARNQQIAKFWIDCLQGFGVIAGVAAVAITYFTYKSNEAIELEKPFREKQLELYADAARVAGNIAATQAAHGTVDQATEKRFWELYYGELVLVESSGEGSVAAKMNEFCDSAFGKERCSKETIVKSGTTPSEKLAIEIANTAHAEIQKAWPK